MLIIDTEAIWSGEVQATELDISFILASVLVYSSCYWHLLIVAFVENNLIAWSI